MTPLDHYRAGELGQATQALGEELRSHPLDTKRRTFLFELLCFAGEFDRAEKHLNVLADAGPNAMAGALVYRSALHAERTRQRMFLNGELPVLQTPNEASSGTWNDQPFTLLEDADPRIGSHLETFIAGGYTWVPTRYIERIEIEPPATLRDLIWARARMQASPAFRVQDLGEVLLPVLSPLSYTSTDDAVRLGRKSVWEDAAGGGERLLGQKLLLVDGEEVPLLEFRSIAWHSAAAPGKEFADAAP